MIDLSLKVPSFLSGSLEEEEEQGRKGVEASPSICPERSGVCTPFHSR